RAIVHALHRGVEAFEALLLLLEGLVQLVDGFLEVGRLLGIAGLRDVHAHAEGERLQLLQAAVLVEQRLLRLRELRAFFLRFLRAAEQPTNEAREAARGRPDRAAHHEAGHRAGRGAAERACRLALARPDPVAAEEPADPDAGQAHQLLASREATRARFAFLLRFGETVLVGLEETVREERPGGGEDVVAPRERLAHDLRQV